jgi:hypothetical protein
LGVQAVTELRILFQRSPWPRCIARDGSST